MIFVQLYKSDFMDHFTLISWGLYFSVAGLLFIASWRLMRWLFWGIKITLLLTQAALLLTPAPLVESGWAPAFIVILLDYAMGLHDPLRLTEQLLLLAGAMLGAWLLAGLMIWSRRRQQPKQAVPKNE